MTNAKRTKEST